jgi:hypothetical protein
MSSFQRLFQLLIHIFANGISKAFLLAEVAREVSRTCCFLNGANAITEIAISSDDLKLFNGWTT